MTEAQLHELEREYGLFKDEILDAINRRFRAKVTLEGAVAEVHLGKHIQALKDAGIIERFEVHDQDGYPDYSLWLPGWTDALRVECKNVRDSEEAYRQGGEVTAYKVETQKTRASKGDRSSRFYGYDQFEILAVCMGKKTHDWHQSCSFKASTWLATRSTKTRWPSCTLSPFREATSAPHGIPILVRSWRD